MLGEFAEHREEPPGLLGLRPIERMQHRVEVLGGRRDVRHDVFVEHHLSRGAYRRTDGDQSASGRWSAGPPGARPTGTTDTEVAEPMPEPSSGSEI